MPSLVLFKSHFDFCWHKINGIQYCQGSSLIVCRRRTIISLLQQKEEWIDKEKMLLSQLWAALEEKLENKSMLKESRTELDKIKGENRLTHLIFI